MPARCSPALPPTGIGQPTEWASVASISPAPADTSDGNGEIAWAATPVNNARASSPASDRQAGVPWASIRSPRRRTEPSAVGKDRLSESMNSTTVSECATNGPSRRRQDAPSSSLAQVCARS
ncbi:Uncharacterised protein [Mycobacterium tuberculosis]|nr:Uncharacterised protein [Mycobacterium tuberculosis]